MKQEVKYRKRNKLLIAFAAAIPFIVLGIDLLESEPIENYPNLKTIVGITTLLFWTILITTAVVNYIRNPIGLIMNLNGFQSYTDNNQGIEISWENTDEIRILKVNGKELVGINLKKDYQTILAKNKSECIKLIDKNKKKYRFDIIINPKSINQKSKDLIKTMENYNSRKLN